MARVASGFGVIEFVAVQTRVHGGDAGDFGNFFHLRNATMAGLTLNAGSEMCAMLPLHAGQNFIDANPEDGLLGGGEFSEFLDSRFFALRFSGCHSSELITQLKRNRAVMWYEHWPFTSFIFTPSLYQTRYLVTRATPTLSS